MRDNLCVMKFGGTSVRDADCIQRAARIIAEHARHGQVVTVVSAMGGVTNRLIETAHQAAMGDEKCATDLGEWLQHQHVSAIHQLVRDEVAGERLIEETVSLVDQTIDLCRGTALLRELTPRALDGICSIGERLAARLVAAALRELGTDSVAVEATELIATDGRYGQAEPLIDQTRERASARLLPLLESGLSPVVTGFIGASPEGTLTTLGRGGSDYSATILGAALDAGEVIIWTDVDGVLSADPRLVKDARTLNDISYSEAAELAYFGARVLHPKTLRPVTEAGVPIWIRNSFAPEHPGTRITSGGSPSMSGVKAITAVTDVTLVTLGGRGIVGATDVLAKVFAATASVGANVLLISQASSQNDICFVLHREDAEGAIAALRKHFELELAQQKVEHIVADNEVAIVAVVGERMHGIPGIAGRTFSALGSVGVNVIAIAQGSSEYNISFVVEARATQDAVTAVHQEFKLQERTPSVARAEIELAALSS